MSSDVSDDDMRKMLGPESHAMYQAFMKGTDLAMQYRRQRDRLAELLREIVSTINSGRKCSMGGISDTVETYWSVESVRRYNQQLAAITAERGVNG